jgi:hypothetical protein
VLLLLGTAALCPAHATDIRAGDQVVIAPDRPVEDDCAVAGRDVRVGAPVHGDVAAFGGNVVIAGPVNGDVLAAGSTVRLRGTVDDDVRAAGGTVILSRAVGDNAQLAGGTIVVEPGAQVGRDLHIASGSTEMRGTVGRDLVVTGGSARIAGEVGGTVQASAANVTLEPGVVVHGDLVVRGPNPPVVAAGAKVLGRTDYREAADDDGAGLTGPVAPPPGAKAGEWFGWWMFRFLSTVVLGSCMIALFPMLPRRVTDTLCARTVSALAVGGIALIGVPIASLFLAITLVGLPLAVVLAALYGSAALLAGVFIAQPLGGWLLRKLRRGSADRRFSSFVEMAVGAVTLAFAASLPLAGGLVRLMVLIAGTGALFLERRDAWRRTAAASPTDALPAAGAPDQTARD